MRSARSISAPERSPRLPAAAGKAATATAARHRPPRSTGRTAQRSPPTGRSTSATPTTTASAKSLGLEFAAFDHAQRRIGQRHRVILLDDADAGAHETAVGAAPAAPRLHDLAFGVDRVAGKDRVLHIELHVQKREPGVLHRRLHQQPLGKGIDQRRRRETLLDVGFMRQEFEVGKEYLDHAGAVDEIGDVGLGDGASDRLELPADRQVLETEAEPTVSISNPPRVSALATLSSPPRKRGSRVSAAGAFRPGFSLYAGMTRSGSASYFPSCGRSLWDGRAGRGATNGRRWAAGRLRGGSR